MQANTIPWATLATTLLVIGWCAPTLALAAMLSACGQTAAAPTAASPRIPRLTPAPGATPAPPERGLTLLEGLRRRLSSCRGFETEMTSQAEGPWDDGVDTGEQRTNRNRARLRWSKPTRLHGTMLEAPFALMVGGTLETTDGATLTLRPSGLLSVMALKVQATDVKLRNSRNHTFRDSQPAAQLTRLTAPTAVWKLVTESAEALTVEVTGVRRLDGGIDREQVVMAASDLAPRRVTMFAGGRVVAVQTYTGFRWH